MSVPLLCLLVTLLPLIDSQNYYNQQQQQQSRHYPQQTYNQQNQQTYHQQRQQHYQNNYRTPSHPNNYYRTDTPSNQFNITAINYSNKFQTPAHAVTTTTTTPRPPSSQRHYYPSSTRHQNVHHRPTHAPTYGGCNVPSDYWCDSHEMAQRCGVVQQCDHLKRMTSPITVTLMFEALCPFCQRFINNNLGNLYDQFRGKIELELVPWGNSRLLNNGQISCNHGQAECDANRLMSCVIDVVKTKQAIPFIVCFERQLTTYPQVEQALHHCSTFIRNDYHEIRQCYDTERGRQLQRQAAYRTMNIRAHPIIEVPYIVINNYSPSTDANGLNIMSLTQLLNKWLNMRQS